MLDNFNYLDRITPALLGLTGNDRQNFYDWAKLTAKLIKVNNKYYRSDK